MDLNPSILCWNVRGLNSPAKLAALREFVESIRVNVVCLQETKLDVISLFDVMQCLGPFFDGYSYLPACETRGGILIAWDTTIMQVGELVWDTDFITGRVITRGGETWWLLVFYAPQGDARKTQFVEELTARRELCEGKWKILGDFNMILRA